MAGASDSHLKQHESTCFGASNDAATYVRFQKRAKPQERSGFFTIKHIDSNVDIKQIHTRDVYCQVKVKKSARKRRLKKNKTNDFGTNTSENSGSKQMMFSNCLKRKKCKIETLTTKEFLACLKIAPEVPEQEYLNAEPLEKRQRLESLDVDLSTSLLFDFNNVAQALETICEDNTHKIDTPSLDGDLEKTIQNSNEVYHNSCSKNKDLSASVFIPSKNGLIDCHVEPQKKQELTKWNIQSVTSTPRKFKKSEFSLKKTKTSRPTFKTSHSLARLRTAVWKCKPEQIFQTNYNHEPYVFGKSQTMRRSNTCGIHNLRNLKDAFLIPCSEIGNCPQDCVRPSIKDEWKRPKVIEGVDYCHSYPDAEYDTESSESSDSIDLGGCKKCKNKHLLNELSEENKTIILDNRKRKRHTSNPKVPKKKAKYYRAKCGLVVQYEPPNKKRSIQYYLTRPERNQQYQTKDESSDSHNSKVNSEESTCSSFGDSFLGFEGCANPRGTSLTHKRASTRLRTCVDMDMNNVHDMTKGLHRKSKRKLHIPSEYVMTSKRTCRIPSKLIYRTVSSVTRWFKLTQEIVEHLDSDHKSKDIVNHCTYVLPRKYNNVKAVASAEAFASVVELRPQAANMDNAQIGSSFIINSLKKPEDQEPVKLKILTVTKLDSDAIILNDDSFVSGTKKKVPRTNSPILCGLVNPPTDKTESQDHDGWCTCCTCSKCSKTCATSSTSSQTQHSSDRTSHSVDSASILGCSSSSQTSKIIPESQSSNIVHYILHQKRQHERKKHLKSPKRIVKKKLVRKHHNK